MSYEDPGWKRPLLVLVPLAGGRLARRGQGSSSPLLGLRSLWATLVQAIWLLVLVGWYLVDPGASADVVWLVAISAVGVAAIGSVAVLARRPLRGDGAEEVLGAYRARFFIGFALSEVPVLAALVIVVSAAQPFPLLLVGAGASTVGMLLVAPTRGDIRRCQDRLVASGRSVRLGRALVAPPDGGAT